MPNPLPRYGYRPAASTKWQHGIELRELSGGELLDRTSPARRPLQRRIVVDHDHAIARQVDVELEAIRAERHAVIERRDGVLRAQRGAAAMRVNDGHGRILAVLSEHSESKGRFRFSGNMRACPPDPAPLDNYAQR